MKQKVIRDPLYNYVSIDLDRHGWLLELLDTPELQRLRRIHQLGVSQITYPGADHSRLSHSLGVLHLMGLAFQHLEREYRDEQIHQARAPLLAAALVHDAGHGPFSHVFEPCLNIEHEAWSIRAILDEDSGIHNVLRKVHKTLPNTVAELVDAENNDHPPWQKFLLSSQLDMDRLDYLRRDSMFTGAGYGHYDWHRILTTFELHGEGTGRDLVWSEKSKLAIEEYVFARYYMYQNVYLHKTTRGFEKLLTAMWQHARKLHADGASLRLVPAIRRFWKAAEPTVRDYLAIEEFTVLQQIEEWTTATDPALADLARRFLCRDRLAMVESPAGIEGLTAQDSDWDRRLRSLVQKAGYKPARLYCLRDELKAKYLEPYFPEKEQEEQSVKNAIRLRIDGSTEPIEISEVLPRLKPIIAKQVNRVRYYVPRDLHAAAINLRRAFL